MDSCLGLKFRLSSFLTQYQFQNLRTPDIYISANSTNPLLICANRSSLHPPRFSRQVIKATTVMESEQSGTSVDNTGGPMKLLFVEMGVGYDQHGQDITVAAMRACRDAISSNSIPAFRRGSIPGVTFGQMKLQIKLGVPQSLQKFLDIERVKSVFPYGEILNVEVVDGGLICSSGVYVEEMGDKNEDCYIVNAAVYVGY
ncbi:uncharacterized protein LOC8259216 [Ricinus communis]|uniref:uncharacterized protein LOC8259216 n=1 Tax=Ricinus communis TaxID=3988 RepID=UPI00201A2462|nr:uncharacterized protein LOC8259216 [Ricinus communis]XP_048230079.1 uncharacterized protein LOC8259216 [Ricinus communis]